MYSKKLWLLCVLAVMLVAIGFYFSFSKRKTGGPARQIDLGAQKLGEPKKVSNSQNAVDTTPPPQSSTSIGLGPRGLMPVVFGLSGPVTLEDVPEGVLRSELSKLSEDAQNYALRTLGSLRVPLNDVASLRVDKTGHLYYQCLAVSEFVSSGSEILQEDATASVDRSGGTYSSVPITIPPIRHSRPGATKVIYLDFNGHTITGTAWNVAHGAIGDPDYRPAVTSYVAKPFDSDSDPAHFSDQEQAAIIWIWERVAEDYIPFDVDVTTEQPSNFTATTGRVVITSSTDANGMAMPGSSSAAGVAYLDVFGDSDYVTAHSPAIVYADRQYYYDDYIAESVSHEMGHNLSLSHDGTTSPNDAYYGGHGYDFTSWGPIMGAPYNRYVTQWSKGEYFNANNSQDDLAIIAGHLGYNSAISADTNAAAVALSSNLSSSGVVGHTSEADRFSFTVAAASAVSFVATPFARSSDLTGGNGDLTMQLYNSANSLVGSNDAKNGYTRSVTLSAGLGVGTYYLRVSGTGSGTPLSSNPSGYTAYGSLGQYSITGSKTVASSPAFSYQSGAQTVYAGQQANFTISANGSPYPTLQWQRLPAGGSTWANLGETDPYIGTATYSLTIKVVTTAMNGDQYRCLATNIAGTVTSTVGLLTVNAAVIPAISNLPGTLNVSYGEYLNIYANVSGTDPIAYQWKKDGVNLSGMTSYSFYKSYATTADSGTYVLTATNYAGIATSSNVIVTVNPAVAPVISGLPSSMPVAYGNALYLSPTVSGTPPITYQWKKGGVTIPNATSSYYIINAAAATESGSYTLTATNLAGTTVSQSVSVAVGAVVAPSITQPPLSVEATKSSSVNFSVTATGSPPLLYQWYKNGQVIPSAVYSSFYINSITTSDSGSYTVRVTNDGGNVTSTAAELTVLPAVLPTISSWTSQTTISASYPYLSLSANVSGTSPLTYQWFKNGVAIAGANSSYYYYNSVTEANAGVYTLQVSNEAGLAVSPDATVTWTSSANTSPWVDAVQQGNIAYFLATSPGRIMRYDLTAESWLPIVYLPEAKVPTAFLPTAEGVFIAYNTALVRRTLNLQTETPVATSGSTINSVFSFGKLLYFQDGSNGFTYDRSTLVAGPTFPGPYSYLYSGQLNRSTRPVISKSTSKGYVSGSGYNSLIEFPIELDGTITSSTSSPDYYTFAIGSRDYLSPDESLVIDNSGVVYKTADLTYSASLGRPFDDLIFLANGTPVALRGQTLTAHGGANFSETGRHQMAEMGYALFGKSNTTFVFGAPPSNTTNPTVSKVASSALVAAVAAIPGSPANKVFSVEDAFIDSHAVIHLLSRSEQGMVRWDTKTKTFLSTIPLLGRPLFGSYAATIDRYAMVYGDGALTDFFPGAAAKEQNYGNISSQNMPLSLVALDDMTFLNVRQAGTSGDFRMVIGSVGEIKGYSNWSYWALGQRWESSNRRLYSASPYYNGNSMEYVAIPSTGLLTATPTAVANIVSPLRFSGDGTLVLSSNSRILNADLQQVGTLSNSVLDGVWLSDGLYTIRARPTGTELQKWARTSYTKTASLALNGIPLRVFRVDDQNVAVVTLVNGFVSFSLIASDLSVTTSVSNIVTPEMTHALGDFNGDGKADLIWSNTSTGDRSMWLLNGNTVSAGASLGVVPVAWVVSATADFNGDGKSDVFLTNTTNGDRAVWMMNGSAIQTNTFMGTVPVEWVISGTGDFNGDGKADLVWTNLTTGDRAMWLLNGSTVLGGGYLGTIPVDWVISGVGDFNGDGKADLVWSNTVTGERSMWFQNGSTTISGATLNTVPVAWVISGVGDFNADGKADIFLSNTATGDRVIWLMNGSTITTNAFMGTVPVEWTVSGTGDFNGDGKKDLFWSNSTTGDRAMWLLNGSSVTGGGFMGTVPVEWKINH